MILILDEKQQFIFHLSLGLLSLLQFTECEKIRLVGPSCCSGRVEVFHQDSWGTVCDDEWSIANAEVVCRELNCGTAMEAKNGASFGRGKDEIWLDDVQCVGNESSVLQCQHKPFGQNNCGHNEDAGVVCSGQRKSNITIHQQLATNTILGSTIAAWREHIRASEIALSLSTPTQQQYQQRTELAVKQLQQQSPQEFLSLHMPAETSFACLFAGLPPGGYVVGG
ncbi:scavenger receptor cysteine-rich type 1 protein M130-like [Oreochromis aureus]|uniref:scavenger receptor cysteine-rich type 1 protein M130-like n=1 Tax=Oreochromis aureus TaxID=47969 RepID=UPI001953AC6A|nr:scavenger receptor cysteine-rich type 1 protein M130-like [Oreochromis aureus]